MLQSCLTYYMCMYKVFMYIYICTYIHTNIHCDLGMYITRDPSFPRVLCFRWVSFPDVQPRLFLRGNVFGSHLSLQVSRDCEGLSCYNKAILLVALIGNKCEELTSMNHSSLFTWKKASGLIASWRSPSNFYKHAGSCALSFLSKASLGACGQHVTAQRKWSIFSSQS